MSEEDIDDMEEKEKEESDEEDLDEAKIMDEIDDFEYEKDDDVK
jgi:hypothetical protein